MAKRFADTNKYKKPFIRSLPCAYKVFWDFLYLDCDHAGIWIVDMPIAQTYIGDDAPIDKKTALELFNKDEVRIVEIDGGKKWFIVPFIGFQYGHLSEKNRAHVAAISTLKKFNLLEENLMLKTFSKPLTSPLQGAKDKEKEKEKDMDKEKDSFGKSENLYEPQENLSGNGSVVTQMWLLWQQSFPSYTADQDSDYVALGKILSFMQRQNNGKQFSKGDDEIRILNTFQLIADQVGSETFWVNKSLKSISSNIQEFYNKIKNPINGNSKQSTRKNGTKPTTNDVQEAHARRYSGRG